MTSSESPRVVLFAVPQPVGTAVFDESLELLPWDVALDGSPDVQGVFMFGHEHVDGAMMDRLPDLRVVSNCGVGVDHIDLAAAKERGIRVGYTPGVLDQAVADLAFTLMLSAGRRLVYADRYARSPAFTKVDHNYMLGRNIHGATLGIVGLGSIGTQIARRANAFDMPIVYHNRSRNEQAEAAVGATYVSFDKLLKTSDYIMLMLPLTEQTRGLINAEAIGKMRPTATLINMARGPVVDTEAIAEALAEKRIYHAALDVTDPEPLPRDHPLLSMKNLTLTPHIGSATVQARTAMTKMAVANLMAGLNGTPMVHEISV